MGIKKIPVLELMELAEHFIPVAAINNRVGIGKIRIIVILCIDTSVVILFPVNIMGQIEGFILRRLQYGEADIRAGDFQPGISLRIDLLQGGYIGFIAGAFKVRLKAKSEQLATGSSFFVSFYFYLCHIIYCGDFIVVLHYKKDQLPADKGRCHPHKRLHFLLRFWILPPDCAPRR